MAKEGEEKTAFIISQRMFCYTKMPFGLRNAGATYQRLVDKAFHKQIDRNLEVYVDDLVIKSRTKDEIVRDIEETFKTLREINMKLNPKKYTFGVQEGMFLGYTVNTKGLKVCPDNVDAVLSLPSLRCLKDVQKLNRNLTSLNRFLAKLTEKSLPFFKTLKKCTKKSDFHWITEAEEAFKQIKQLIGELPMLTVSVEKEELIVYLAATKEMVSTVLMTEREAKQMSIYFVTRALRGSEINYTSMEKLVPAFVHTSKHLNRYFQAHPIIVIMDQPIQQVLSRPKVAGRLQKWSIELGEYAIHYRPRVSVKGSFYTDGFGAGLILTNPEGMEFTYTLRFRCRHDQIPGKSKNTYQQLQSVSIRQVPRSKIKKADILSKITSTSFAHLSKQILVEELKENSINKVEILLVEEEEGDTWMTVIFEYLTKETLPADVKEARAVRRKSQRFAVINGTIYKKNPRTMVTQHLTPITSLWPFYKWGIDIAGPFSKRPGKVKFLIVAMNYFTKRIEANPMATITGNQDNPFKDWCEKLCTHQHFASVKHPQTNGLVERANRSMGEGIKARSDAGSKNWMEELSHVLWAHRTMIKSSNGDTPFSLHTERKRSSQ
nr:reverse transcriptase domain-containing protein [Tanacetum cinerariifolium]